MTSLISVTQLEGEKRGRAQAILPRLAEGLEEARENDF